MEFISEHWLTLLGGGSITGFFGWVFYGRKNQNAEFTSKVQGIYDNLVDDLKKDREALKEENARIKKEHREDVIYFRSEISPLREELQSLRKKSDEQERQIADLSLINAITKEAADSWEAKFKILEKEHDKLKKDFDTLRKSMK